MVEIFQAKLVPQTQLSPEMMMGLRNAALKSAVDAAAEAERRDSLTSRALLATDLGETNNLWGGQTGSSGNTWENSIIASQAIADDTWIGIYGLIDTSAGPFISAIRWDVGAGKRSQWSVDDYFTDDERQEARTAFALSPIVITKRQSVTIEFYVRGTGGTNKSVQIAYMGWVVEKGGVNQDP